MVNQPNWALKTDFNCVGITLSRTFVTHMRIIKHASVNYYNMQQAWISWSNCRDYATIKIIWQMYRLGDTFYLWKYVYLYENDLKLNNMTYYGRL